MEAPTPVPWRTMGVVMCLVFSEGVSMYLLLPFVSYMVIGMGVSADDVGYYAGFITSSFFVAQFFASFFIGRLSDRWGRKPLMLIGLCGNAVCALAFGFSKSLVWALVTRSLNGLVNGNTGVVKSYVRDVSDSSNQARCYSLRSSAFAMGLILAPFAGGVLSRPADHFSLFDTPFWRKYPYLLPCLVSSVINVFGVVFTAVFLKEAPAKAGGARVVRVSGDGDAVRMDRMEMDDGDGADGVPMEVMPSRDHDSPSAHVKWQRVTDTDGGEADEGVVLHTSAREGRERRVHHDDDDDEVVTIGDVDDVDADDVDDNDDDDSVVALLGDSHVRERQRVHDVAVERHDVGDHDEVLLWRSNDDVDTVDNSDDTEQQHHHHQQQLQSVKEILREPDVLFIILLYSVLAFLYMAFDEIFSVWSLRSPELGGLGFDEFHMGLCHMVAGVCMICFQLFLYPPLDDRYGSRFMWLCLMALLSTTFWLFPLSNFLTQYPPLMWIWVLTGAFSAINLAISNCAPASSLGAINGISASFASALRILAPIASGSFFAWSSKHGPFFPFNWYFAYLVMGLIGWSAVATSLRLPVSINKRRYE